MPSYFVNPPSKFERALRSLLINQGKATWENSFISNDYRAVALPNRRFVVSQFNPTRPYRMEGVCHCEIQHHFQAVNDQGQPATIQRVLLDSFLGDTFDTLNLGGALNDTNMAPLADAITNAGRWLGTNNPAGNTATEQDIVNDNLDMLNFRCDWVKFLNPLQTRGRDTDTTNWVEIIHLSAFISNASIALPN
jgi:hypothetical protein